MEFFKQNTSIDFMRLRLMAAIVSIILFALSAMALLFNGLNWGLDFTGGTQLQVKYEKTAPFETIRQSLAQAGYKEALVQSYGDDTNAMIKLAAKKGENSKNLAQQVMQVLPGAQLVSVEFIGPEVGSELATNGALALLVALLITAVYIAMRFEYRFAVSASVALIHDPILILGVFSFLHITFDLTALAAVLTILGYSLNDTIVVFDRVRENFRRMRKANASEVVNAAVNQTLSRTIITSGLTLVAVVALYLFGGEMIRGFSLALIIGIVVGTYSSIYVAGSLAVALGLNRKDFIPTPKAELDDRP